MSDFDSDLAMDLLVEEEDRRREDADLALSDYWREQSGDVCRCGREDLWNGSVVCWVCEEVVVEWDAARHGPLSAQTFPVAP